MDHFFQLSQKLQLLNLLISSIVGFAEKRRDLRIEMCSRIIDVLESCLIVSWLAWELDFENCIEEVFFIRVFVELFGESLESVPVL